MAKAIEFRKMYYSEGNEIMFGIPKKEGLLPAVMIKIKFKELTKDPFQDLLLYDEYIPFSLKIGNSSFLPETLYARNLYGEDFIEFRFNKETRCLYEITLVAFQPDKISILENTSFKRTVQGVFCCMIEDESELDISKPVEIFRNSDTLCIVWSKAELNYFSVTENCVLGIDEENGLSAVVLTCLDEKDIDEIVGK